MANNEGGYAFPQHGFTKDPEVLERMSQNGGMTLRDWFAGMAMSFWTHAEIGGWCGDFPAETASRIARQCYVVADAMIQARRNTEVQ